MGRSGWIVVAAVILAAAMPAAAQERTTPVEVKNSPTVGISSSANTVKIDGAANGVKAEQSGAWSVGIAGTPAVSISGTADVNATQAGTWNVGIVDTANTVKSPTLSKTLQFWAADQTLGNAASLSSPIVACAGFKEARVVLTSSSSANTLTAQVRFWGAGAAFTTLGACTFGGTDGGLVTGGNFVKAGYTCAFTVPVMGQQMQIHVINQTGGDVTLYNNGCWAHLVN